MKKKNTRTNSVLVGTIAAVLAFVAISAFAGGIVTISREVGAWRWLLDQVSYAFFNKFAMKMVASLAVGFSAYFVSRMIEYGKVVKSKKRVRTTAVRFTPDDTGVGRTA